MTKPTSIEEAPMALIALNSAIKRLQMDIDDGSRPDQWTMQDIQEDIRKGRDFIEALRTALQGQAVAQPVAWMRKWQFDGEVPKKERNANGRWAWPTKFKFLPITVKQCFRDDVALVAAPSPAVGQAGGEKL